MKKGFTLIELLIVVAIIAILAAIAVPNFLEAQVRAKVSRAKNDLRTITTGLESYFVDYNTYPYDGYNYAPATLGNTAFSYWYIPRSISTPQAYLTSAILKDPFRAGLQNAVVTPSLWQADNYRYVNTESTWGLKWDVLEAASSQGMTAAQALIRSYWQDEWGGWKVNSCGPDKFYGPPLTGAADSGSPYYTTAAGGANCWKGVSKYGNNPLPFDPTNGTVSVGDINRSAAASNGYKNAS